MAKKSDGRRQHEAATAPTDSTPATGAPQAAGNGGRKPPVFEYRCGRIKCVVWENPSAEHGKWYSVNLVRTYKDEATGTWKSASSLGRDDLLPAALALQAAYRWVNEQLGGGAFHPQAGNGSGDQPPPAAEEPIPV